MPRRSPEPDTVTEVEFTFKCKGLSAADLQAIYRGLKEQFPDGRTAFRNPCPIHFDPQTVHQITLCLYAAGMYIGKKFIDKAADIAGEIVKQKLMATDDDTERKTVAILGPDGKALFKVEQKSARRC